MNNGIGSHPVGAVCRMLGFICLLSLTYASANSQIDIPTPPGSVRFGSSVAALPNHNIVFIDEFAPPSNAGAVFLCSPNGTIIRRFGGLAGDMVGSGGIVVLGTGNFLVLSPLWQHTRGAVTWVDATTGLAGTVSPSNSLVGSMVNDSVGGSGVKALTNGNYIVQSASWSGSRGAVTWGDGKKGISGFVSAANSMVGSTPNDFVGLQSLELTNGNVVTWTPDWSNGGIPAVGAVTWLSGTKGLVGAVGSSNSLIGSTANDNVGMLGVIALTNGNYVVSSPFWNNMGVPHAGAVTWADGGVGLSGEVTEGDSLVGSTQGDLVGSPAVVALANGNYVVASAAWNNLGANSAGAATLGNGSYGTVGAVTELNSLVGTTASDKVGSGGVTPLSNGNYVVASPYWNRGVFGGVGAATFGNGIVGVTGPVSSANSLVGFTPSDAVASDGITPLANGNYVVASSHWTGASPQVGAVTWGSGDQGIAGDIDVLNSLVGSTQDDRVGYRWNGVSGVTALTNGNYVVASPYWTNNAASHAGAATWGNGDTGTAGPVSQLNSLYGNHNNDNVGFDGVVTLSNGNYVVASSYWTAGVKLYGAATWGDGKYGTTGLVSAANSLIGSQSGDRVSSGGVVPLSDGSYVIASPEWSHVTLAQVGAVTWGSGTSGVAGIIQAGNSLLGTTVGDKISSGGVYVLPATHGGFAVYSPLFQNGVHVGAYTFGETGVIPHGIVNAGVNSVVGFAPNGRMVLSYDPTHRLAIIGRPNDNIVSLFQLP